MGSQYSEFCTERITPVEAQQREISSMTMLYAMWSKPAPPSSSGKATPVRPSSAAFLNVSRGKCPVSSSSRASGFTSDSANSRTLFCSNFCSSVSSRFKVVFSAHKPDRRSYSAFYVPVRACCSEEGRAKPVVRGLQIFRVDAGLTSHGHKVRIAGPARQGVQVQVSRHSRSGGAPQIHAKVHSVRFVGRAESRLDALRELHHLFQCLRRAQVQFGHMGVWHDHDVSRCIRVSV